MSDLLSKIEDKITKAISLYGDRDGDIADVETVYKSEFDVDEDIDDAGIAIVNLPTGQAQVKIHKAYLSLGIDLSIQVLAHDETATEEKVCTKLEKYLAAVQWENESQSHKRAYTDFLWYFLVRGAGVLKTLFFPELVNTSRFPIRILARDYRYVYPVFGDHDLLYVVEEYERYAGDLREELLSKWRPRVQADPDAVVWRPPDLTDYGDTDKVTVTEYWDNRLKGLRVGNKWVWLQPHHYEAEDGVGIIPYSFAWCERTPLDDGKWMARSILAPIKDIIKQESQLMSKVATATELFYYPQIFVETPDGQAFVASTAPGQFQPVPPGSKTTVINPVPNQMLLNTLMGWYEKGVSLFGLPDAMWGVQPGQVQAGYAISLLQGAAKTKLDEKAQDIERAFSRSFEQVLRLTEIFAVMADDEGFELYPAPAKKQVGGSSERATPMKITADDVDGHYRVRVKITPEVPTDQALKWRIAGMARQRDPLTKLTAVSDAYVREEILGIRHPDVEAERVLDEYLATNPDVQEAQARLFVHEWMKDHEKELRALERAEEREAQKRMKELQEMVMAEFMAAVERGEVPPGLMPTQGAMPPGAAPPGMPPGMPQGMPQGVPQQGPGLPPETMPPSLMGRGPETATPEEAPLRATERLVRGQ